ncbi:MAG TPA: rod shape-determining protein MreC [Prevotella sp.]
MRNLLAFLARYNHWFVFILLEVASLVLLFQHNSYQGSVWFSSANAVAGKVYEWNSQIEAFFSLSSVNKDLTLRNLLLERQVTQLTELVDSLSKDTTLALRRQASSLRGYKLISAQVVGNMVDKADNLITLDKGSADGVKKDMGVVCGTGVVGIVYLVSQHYSVVIPVLNTRSNISCKIQGRGYFGYLRWMGGASDKAFVDDIPRHAHFRLNDHVVTSGYSSVFPPGILVGKIIHVYNSPDGVSYRLNVKLSTDFAKLRDVYIIDNAQMQERIEVLRAAQDSIKSKDN